VQLAVALFALQVFLYIEDKININEVDSNQKLGASVRLVTADQLLAVVSIGVVGVV
jgi:hypothetical protein